MLHGADTGARVQDNARSNASSRDHIDNGSQLNRGLWVNRNNISSSFDKIVHTRFWLNAPELDVKYCIRVGITTSSNNKSTEGNLGSHATILHRKMKPLSTPSNSGLQIMPEIEKIGLGYRWGHNDPIRATQWDKGIRPNDRKSQEEDRDIESDRHCSLADLMAKYIIWKNKNKRRNKM
jgi:hypothetical protein